MAPLARADSRTTLLRASQDAILEGASTDGVLSTTSKAKSKDKVALRYFEPDLFV